MISTKITGAVSVVLTLGSTVQIWMDSPTGGSSDAHIFDIPTTSEAHAHAIANMWRKAWNLPLEDAPLEF